MKLTTAEEISEKLEKLYQDTGELSSNKFFDMYDVDQSLKEDCIDALETISAKYDLELIFEKDDKIMRPKVALDQLAFLKEQCDLIFKIIKEKRKITADDICNDDKPFSETQLQLIGNLLSLLILMGVLVQNNEEQIYVVKDDADDEFINRTEKLVARSLVTGN